MHHDNIVTAHRRRQMVAVGVEWAALNVNRETSDLIRRSVQVAVVMRRRVGETAGHGIGSQTEQRVRRPSRAHMGEQAPDQFLPLCRGEPEDFRFEFLHAHGVTSGCVFPRNLPATRVKGESEALVLQSWRGHAHSEIHVQQTASEIHEASRQFRDQRKSLVDRSRAANNASSDRGGAGSMISRSPPLRRMASPPDSSNSRGIRTARFRPFLNSLARRYGLTINLLLAYDEA